MTRSPKYPLDPLLEHRARGADDATAALGAAVAACEGARRAVEAADRERRDAEARAEEIRLREAGMLSDGQLRAVDLARIEAWEIAMKVTLEEKREALDRRERALADAQHAEAEARARLAVAKAEHDAVAKDKERFASRARHAAFAVEEEAAEDAYGAARGRSR